MIFKKFWGKEFFLCRFISDNFEQLINCCGYIINNGYIMNVMAQLVVDAELFQTFFINSELCSLEDLDSHTVVKSAEVLMNLEVRKSKIFDKLL